MLAAERHDRIVALLESERYVSSDALAEALRVSLETIRRDLSHLDHQGRLVRVRGGASHIPSQGEEAAYPARTLQATEEKTAMANTAAALVEPRMTVMIDVGTSCLSVARALPADFRGRVVTCSLLVAAELAERSDIELLVAGGRVRPGDLAVSNATAVEFFSDLRPDIAFLGSGGIDAEAGLTDYYVDEVATRRVVLETAARSYVMADKSKHGRVAPVRVCDLEELTGLIADSLSDESLYSGLARAGVQALTSTLPGRSGAGTPTAG